jgi:hypothetical protein
VRGPVFLTVFRQNTGMCIVFWGWIVFVPLKMLIAYISHKDKLSG